MTGRYHPQKYYYYYSFLKDIVIKIPLIFLFINITIFLLRTFDNNIFFNFYEIINIKKIIIYVSFVASIRLINKLFENKINKKSKNWIFIGSKKTFKELTQELKKQNYPTIMHLSKQEPLNLRIKDSTEGLILDEENNLTIEDIDFIESSKEKGLKIFNLIDWVDIFLQRLPIKLFHDKSYFVRQFDYVRRSSKEDKLKRIGDFFLSLFLFVLTLPIIVLAAVFIYLEDRGGVFYSQKRCGKNGKIFYITKLRTMYLNSEDNGAQWSKRNDPRITKIVSILRKTLLYELPQLLSVMKGDMSLIGPRPERPEFDKELIELIPFYKLRDISLNLDLVVGRK